MSLQTLSNPADVANRLQTYFSRKMLPHITNELVLSQFATKQDLPANAGAKTIRFFRKRQGAASNVSALTEGVALATYTEVTMDYLDVTLKQRGQIVKLSDILQATDIFNALEQNIETIGEDAALDFDSICRNSLVANPAVAAHNIDAAAVTLYNSNAAFERFAGVTNTLNSGNDFTSLAALSAAAGKITRIESLKCATQLKNAKVPQLDGGYVCVTSPAVMHDIRQDTDWMTAATRVNGGRALYKRESVTLDGVTFVEQNNPFIESVYGTFSSAGTIYTSIFLGKGAFGTPNLGSSKVGSNPNRPKVVVISTPDKSDALNQYTLAGWKAYWASALLWPKTGAVLSAADACPFAVTLRTKSTFV